MKYTNYNGFEISKLGFGIMRMPVAEGKSIDEEESIRMIRHGIDSGITYIDTAHVYHDGLSEVVVGKALLDGYRERVMLATKLNILAVKKESDMYDMLEAQLEKLQTKCIDFYLLHSLNKASFAKFKQFNYKKFLDYALKEGKIKYPAFSFHDIYTVFEQIIGDYDWKMCQIQLNYTDDLYQAGVKGLQLAKSKGIKNVIMEPLKGGMIAKDAPVVRKEWEEAGFEYEPISNCFRFVAGQDNILTILSGMSEMGQLKHNLEIFETLDLSPLSEQEIELYKKAKAGLIEKIKVGCTGCSYCMPCPCGVDIPNAFRFYNNSVIYDAKPQNAFSYDKFLVKRDCSATNCIACGKCEKECPQHLEIIEKLKEAHTFLIDN